MKLRKTKIDNNVRFVSEEPCVTTTDITSKENKTKPNFTRETKTKNIRKNCRVKALDSLYEPKKSRKLLISIENSTSNILEQTKTTTQKTLEFILKISYETYSVIFPSNSEDDWLRSVTNLEFLNSVSNIIEGNYKIFLFFSQVIREILKLLFK